MVDPDQIQRSKAIQRRTGRTFHFATRLLPERVRHATYVLYAFFRIADEVVDDPDAEYTSEEQASRLEELRAEALGEREPHDPVLGAFRDLADEYDIPDGEIDLFVDAMKADIDKKRYHTYAELEEYMRGSASAVGVMMTAIIEPDDRETAVPHAVALGEAFQMTNFIRDVREDILDRDRIYLPRETLTDHGVDFEDVERLEFSEAMAAAVAEELRRTERLYREGVAGIKYLSKDTQFAVLLASVLYAEHHRLIRSNGYDVVNERPSLSLPRKVWLLLKTRWLWTWNKDPEAVFRRVSAVPDSDRHASERESGAVPAQ
jgi:phytoene synthase (EC 2.5.1.32)